MLRQPLNRDTLVDYILDLFTRRGSEAYMGEPVNMAQHMEQTAACAVADDASDNLVIAALLHDIGHFVGDFPIDALETGIDNLHELAAAKFLQDFYPASVTEPIRLHVAAKKYLCALDGEYFAHLSAASVQSLQVQGGPMTETEIEAFESSPYHQAAVQLRHYDDDGKVAGLDIKPVQSYQNMLQSVLKP
ncbi:MAG: HD domain-containing protein [Gammaproteobacteria bacterium]|jgi:predicted HD phosphohydrolase|nr:HD domain-containing protein [Gammaproteobacteria bacterium]MCZ6669158.1 HD domain-containing protein [Gammaproteobacteria bacterium]